MNSYQLLHSFGAIKPEFILEAQRFLGYSAAPGSRIRNARRGVRTLLLAAVISLLLAACGLAVYHATMLHRQPKPSDEMRYYLNGNFEAESDLRLNFGESALILHFDTEEEGTAHAFRIGANAGLDPSWVPGLESPVHLLSFLNSFTPEVNERLSSMPGLRSLPEDQVRPLKQSLQEAGVSVEEAETWYRKMDYYYGDGSDRLVFQLQLKDGPWLHGIDLICGMPKGEATVYREGSFGEYQILEVLIDTDFGDPWGHDRVNYLFLFHPTKQYLLSFAAHADIMDFTQLEQVAESTEVLDTGFAYRHQDGSSNWSYWGFGNG